MEEYREIESRIKELKMQLENETAKLLMLRLEMFIDSTQYESDVEFGLDRIEYRLLSDMIERQNLMYRSRMRFA